MTPWTIGCQTLLFVEFPKHIGVSCLFLLQGIFLTKALNAHLLHWQAGSLPLSHQGRRQTWLSYWACTLMTTCCCSVSQSCLALCNPMDCSMPGFPVLHHLPEHVQTHVHWVSDAIQPSRSLSSPSTPAFFPSIFPSIRVFSNELPLHIG